MPTHEREITTPVDLCLPDGQQLNPEAKGYSRTPLHNGNLIGSWGRTKKWDYWAVLAPGFALAITYADVNYLGMATIWWCDFKTGKSGGHDPFLLLARGVSLPDKPGSAPLKYESSVAKLEISDDAEQTNVSAEWTEQDGSKGKLDLRVELPPGHESVNVVIPWTDHLFQYTSKHQARPAHGTLTVGEMVYEIGRAGEEAWGVLDVGRGRWPYNTNWNWGGGAGRSVDGKHVVGIQFGAKWTEGTGFTENGIIVDGRLNKIGEELIWEYDWDRPMEPWRVRHEDGSLDLVLKPVYDRYSNTNVYILKMEVHQVFGTWSGHVTSESGERIEVKDAVGFAEESRSWW